MKLVAKVTKAENTSFAYLPSSHTVAGKGSTLKPFLSPADGLNNVTLTKTRQLAAEDKWPRTMMALHDFNASNQRRLAIEIWQFNPNKIGIQSAKTSCDVSLTIYDGLTGVEKHVPI
jgi:hypothetical protein